MGWFKSSTFTTTQLTKQKNVKKGNNLNLFSLFNRINTTIHCLNSSFSKTSLIAPLSRNILAQRAHCWCLAINLTCLIFPKVIVLVRLAGNHLCTMSLSSNWPLSVSEAVFRSSLVFSCVHLTAVLLASRGCGVRPVRYLCNLTITS